MSELTKKFIKHSDGTGTFNLSITFQANAVNHLQGLKIDLGEVKMYLEKTFFKIVSLLLERATYGQHNLSVSFSEEDIDILITKETTNAFGSRIWNVGFVAFSLQHLYSPGLMIHELGHYLYGLRDEFYGSCRGKHVNTQQVSKASIMEFTYGGNTRFRRWKNRENGTKEIREYNVFGGLKEFWSDYKGGDGIKDGMIEIKYQAGEVVTDFCNNYKGDLEHNGESDCEQNKAYKDENGKGRSCWSVMLDDKIGGIDRGDEFKYSLRDPFAEENNDFKKKFEKEKNIEIEIEALLGMSK